MEPSDTETGPRRWGRRRTIGVAGGGVAVAAVIALLVVGLLNRGVGSSIQSALAEGERPTAPEVELPVLVAGDGVGPEGALVRLSDLRGRVVVLNFWASWCPPCEAEAPLLDSIAARYRDGGDVLVLGLDVQDLRDKALAFVRRHNLRYPSLRDPGDASVQRFEVTGLPETFVIDREGRIALKKIGEVRRAEELTTAIEGL